MCVLDSKMHVHITQIRGIATILQAMQSHVNSADVQLNACRVLANLALTSMWVCVEGRLLSLCAEEVREYMLKESAVSLVQTALKTHHGNGDAQHYGFWCLTNFAIDGRSARAIHTQLTDSLLRQNAGPALRGPNEDTRGESPANVCSRCRRADQRVQVPRAPCVQRYGDCPCILLLTAL